MSKDKNKSINDINSSAIQDGKQVLARLKIIPLLVVYQLWLGAIIVAYGWTPALASILASACWFVGWPKGFLKNTLFVFFFAIILPFMLIAFLGLEPDVTKK